MRLTIIRPDGFVGIDGVFKKVDMAGLSAGIRVVQWDGANGHIEFDNDISPNLPIDNIDDFQSFVAMWNMPPQLPNLPAPMPAEMIATAQGRISGAYMSAVMGLTAGYSDEEIASWPKQEREARAWLADNSAVTPWIDAAYVARGITKTDLVSKIIANADALAPLHGALIGKRQKLRDQIVALGSTPTQAQLDAVQW